MKQIQINSEAWTSLFEEIRDNFGDGTLIPHKYLKTKFCLENLNKDDYQDTDDFVQALQLQQFAYLTLVDTLRWQLLEEEKMYLKNVRGDGYVILKAKDQVQYGYDSFIYDFKKAAKEANLIMTNVRNVNSEQQFKDNDLRAKMAMLNQMIKSIK
jgi:hypothetical protein